MTPPSPTQGTHVLIDMHGATRLDDCAHVETVLREAAIAAGAEILSCHIHHFGEGQGVTGVVLLAESHASIHTWPERGYAAIDLFLCGTRNDLDAAIAIMDAGFSPEQTEERRIARGYPAGV